MIEIKKDIVHCSSSQNLRQISNDEWKIIEQQKNSFLISDECDTSFLRWPGYVFSNSKAQQAYLKIYKDFVDNNIYTPSRGNLSKNNNYIFIGIRPGHVYAHLSKADTAWLFGPSSTLLHKLLIETKIFPYFTNIYNEPDKPMNKDFSFITKELIIIFYIYSRIYKMKELNLVFMGAYEEYGLFVKHILEHRAFRDVQIPINCFSIWHPAYLSRGYDQMKFDDWKRQLINKNRLV